MSIVPREVIVDAPAAWNAQADEFNQWDELGEDEKLEWTADRAAQWALEQAAQLCDAQARLDYDAYDLTGNAYSEGAADAADGLATKLRAMMKGGEA
jgi:hypothetical protein